MPNHVILKGARELSPDGIKEDLATFGIRMLARKMTSLINKLIDWPPNYHFQESSGTLFSVCKLTLNKSPIYTGRVTSGIRVLFTATLPFAVM